MFEFITAYLLFYVAGILAGWIGALALVWYINRCFLWYKELLYDPLEIHKAYQKKLQEYRDKRITYLSLIALQNEEMKDLVSENNLLRNVSNYTVIIGVPESYVPNIGAND